MDVTIPLLDLQKDKGRSHSKAASPLESSEPYPASRTKIRISSPAALNFAAVKATMFRWHWKLDR
jgi:hypothetical protein